MSGTYEDKSLSFQQIQVDSAAFRIFGFRDQVGQPGGQRRWGWYLNELAFKQMELSEDALLSGGAKMRHPS